MISSRSMEAAKRVAIYESLGPPEQLPYFVIAQKDKTKYWVLRNGKWRPRKDGWQLSEETKYKMKRRKNDNEEILH